MSLLQVEKLQAFYGKSQALFNVNLEVAEGEITALLGRNGTGKSTTVKAICRMIPSAGTLTFGGVDLHDLASHRVARLGVGLVPEGRRCFADLSVRENLLAAARAGEWTFETVGALFPRLAERRDQRAATLSGGEQQMLAIGRALTTNPRLLILDEATEGLAPNIRQEIWGALGRLKAETGLTIIVIDKSLSELRAIADRCTVLERGETVWNGQMAAFTADISDRYVGV